MQEVMLSSEDLTVAKVELPHNRSFMIASSYMAHEKTAPPDEVSDLLAVIETSDDIILGCDANARHTIWGSSETNERDFITIYHQEEKLWKGLDKPKLCNDNISAGAKALEVLRSQNPQDIMQISDSEKTTMTYGSALKAAIKIAEYFKSLSLNADDVVGILAPDTTYVMPVALASWFNGTPFQAINCKWETAVVRNLYEFSRPKIIFCDGLQYEKVKAACENFKPLIYTLCNHLENVPQIEDLLQRVSGYEENLYQAEPLKYGSKQTMVIMVSSGTSGMPKGVCVPNSTCITDFGFTNDTTKMFSTSSIDWSSGLLTFMANVLVGGTRIITQQHFTAEYLLQLIVKYKINFLSTNPSNLLQASLLKEYTPETMQSIKLIFTAGSHCSELNLERMRSALTKGLLFYGYGGTETGGVAGRLNSNKPKSVGRLLPNVQLKIVNVNNGERLGPNEIGEICVRHNYEWCGYYNNAKATADTLDSEGFIHTGDLGYMDEDNFLFLTGRCKDIMKYLGFQYSPNDIEEIIAEMEDVVDVCVFGVYDEVKQDVAAAAVVKREGSTLTKQQVIKYVESKTEVQHKRIHYGVFFVKELPRNHNGKLLRDKIKKICLEMERCDKNE
ncbi:luciferin 4-monooxygenase-like isoform X2 [Lucilia cuprina]|uniref:luciferin 4-monooxygenase-like isoform X2 n=1 Tax=Lucilia cuprina TaxID=7375 RepID=UPI001F05CD26|nr:luciferin 4-monooxygenase-like isoform X2 [Lucilia cuprina]